MHWGEAVKRSPLKRSAMPRQRKPMKRKPARNSAARERFRKGVRARSGGRCEYVYPAGTRCDFDSRQAHHIHPVGSHPHLIGCVDDGADLCKMHHDFAHLTDVAEMRRELLASMPAAQRERLELARKAGK